MQLILNLVCCLYEIQVQLGILHFHWLNLAAVVPGEGVLERVSKSLACWQKKELHLKVSEEGDGGAGDVRVGWPEKIQNILTLIYYAGILSVADQI